MPEVALLAGGGEAVFGQVPNPQDPAGDDEHLLGLAQAGGHIAALADDGALVGGLAPVVQAEDGGNILSPRRWQTPPAPALPTAADTSSEGPKRPAARVLHGFGAWAKPGAKRQTQAGVAGGPNFDPDFAEEPGFIKP